MGTNVSLSGLTTAVAAVAVLLACVAYALHVRNARNDRVAAAEGVRAAAPDDGALAATLQSALMPAMLPIMDGLILSASYAPATLASAAGGDFYDAFVLDDGALAVVVGDAAGGGIAAALTMNVVRQALRNAFIEGARPVEALRRANRLLLRSDASAFVSAIVGTIDPATLQFRYACAGHPPPLLATLEGPCVTLPGMGTGIALGIVPFHVATEHVVNLPPDALLALYTDGCVEMDRDIIAGTAALGEALVEARKLGLSRPAIAIERAIVGTHTRSDDAAILTIAPTVTLTDVNLRLPADAASLGLARTAMRRFFAGTPLDDARAYEASVATGEAISNAVEHAYVGRAVQTFGLRARCDDDDSIWVTIEDYGVWPRASDEPLRGRGLGIMHELADGCEIERDDDGTRVTLRFLPGTRLAEATLS